MTDREFLAAAEKSEFPLTLKDERIAEGQKALSALFSGMLWNPEPGGMLDIPCRSCLCLSGKPGTGKRTMAEAFAGSAAEKGFQVFWISSKLIHLTRETELAERIRLVFEKAEQQPSLVIAEPCGEKAPWQFLAAQYREAKTNHALILLILESEQASGFISELPEMIFLPVKQPEKPARTWFWEKNRIPGKDFSSQWLIENTDGLSYAELQTVLISLRLELRGKALCEYQGDAGKIALAIQEKKLACSKADVETIIDRIRKKQERDMHRSTLQPETSQPVLPQSGPEQPVLPKPEPKQTMKQQDNPLPEDDDALWDHLADEMGLEAALADLEEMADDE